jgi:hypothetical protein
MTANPKNAAGTQYPGNDPSVDPSQKRDPEDRKVPPDNKRAIREKNLDKTLADSFPTSDPPSTIPDPEDDAA